MKNLIVSLVRRYTGGKSLESKSEDVILALTGKTGRRAPEWVLYVCREKIQLEIRGSAFTVVELSLKGMSINMYPIE